MARFSLPPLRKLVGVFFIMVLLVIFLSLYFLKYIPTQQQNFHHSAFLELKQVESALEERNHAYVEVIQNSLKFQTSDAIGRYYIDVSSLAQSFSLSDSLLRDPGYLRTGTPDPGYRVTDISISEDTIAKSYQIRYEIADKRNSRSVYLLKSFDELIRNLVNSYKDIFDDYLIIRDRHLLKKREDNSSLKDPFHEGEIIFNSGNLSVDYLVNTDSLLKKNDGFSLINVHNVTIEGNPYKLFLYPVSVGKERLILAGLINSDRYNASFKKVPFDLIAIFGVLVLVVLILLPIMKIYIIGPSERVRDIDIRFIIGTFFIAAFVGFFLFADSFLKAANANNIRDKLDGISKKVMVNFSDELYSMVSQLQTFDTIFYNHTSGTDSTLNAMLAMNEKNHLFKIKDSLAISAVFKPTIYPYLKNVFWIDSLGNWVARWGFRKSYHKIPFINVSDRPYFKNFFDKDYFKLPGRGGVHFTIQPNLSRLDGEYSITVVIKSDSSDARWNSQISPSRFLGSKSPARNLPALVGMGTEMNFVNQAILSPGCNFSIINEEGDILFDSKPGVALLSNILKDVNIPGELRQCARYHNTAFFKDVVFKNRRVSMLATPMNGLYPYTLLTYNAISQVEDQEEHLLSLAVIIMAAILSILLFSSMINEWSKKDYTLLRSPNLYFDWLFPVRKKSQYYRHLLQYMILLAVGYGLSWIVIEWLFSKYEFALFFLSLLLPFYAALHYFIIRQRYYSTISAGIGAQKAKMLPALSLVGFYLLALIIINTWAFTYGAIGWQCLCCQALLITIIIASVSRFKRMDIDNMPQDTIKKPVAILAEYSRVIMFGVTLVSILPAMGLFCLLLRQEIALGSLRSQLEIARQVRVRNDFYKERLKDYSIPVDSPLYSGLMTKMRFQSGIYATGDFNTAEKKPKEGILTAGSVSPAYLNLHQLFFPEEPFSATVVSPTSASDSSWYLTENNDLGIQGRAELVYQLENAEDKKPLRRKADPVYYLNAFKMITMQAASVGFLYQFIYFILLVLAFLIVYKITCSLARKIFLFDLFQIKDCTVDVHMDIDKMIKTSSNFTKLQEIMKNQGTISISDIGHFEKIQGYLCAEPTIISIGMLMEPIYSKVWTDLSPREKFLLFDFAIDGFTNYRNNYHLFRLLQMKVLCFHDGRLDLMTTSFREYLLRKNRDEDIVALAARADKEDSWRQFKVPLLLILAVIGIFIFFTQDTLYQKITGLFTSVGSLLPLFGSLFGSAHGMDRKKTMTDP